MLLNKYAIYIKKAIFCTYCAAGYYPQDSEIFVGGATNDPSNCPPGTAPSEPFNCMGAFGNSVDCWNCTKYYGPFYDVSQEFFFGGSTLYLQLCPSAGVEYTMPSPFQTIRCAPDNICCDLNTEKCTQTFGCTPLS